MKKKYDVIIIGSGIGGLVCGCYLAQAGLSVLIVEQHDRPGGCCTSFKRRGYTFDVGVHSIGSLREGGMLCEILKDIEILDKIEFLSNDVLDRIIIPGKTLYIKKNIEETKMEFVRNFKKEAGQIINFFDFILSDDLLKIMSKTKGMSAKDFLDEFFDDYKLKAILLTFLGNIGLPPSEASALVFSIVLKEFVFRGGYYPRGGMQVFPNTLVENFKKYGGEIFFSTKVSRILTKNECVCGVELEDERFIQSLFVVSNADATQTFTKLLDVKSEENKKTKDLKTSLSAFVIYLGLDCNLDDIPKHFVTWHFLTDDIEKCYSRDADLIKSNDISYLLCTFPSLIDDSIAPLGKSVVRVFVGADYGHGLNWGGVKEEIGSKIMGKFNQLFPGLGGFIEVQEVGTPETFQRYTLNKNGALYGWAATPEQVNKSIFPARTSVGNLYLTGHWVTNGVGQSGIGTVAFSGRNTAKLILRKNRREAEK